MSDFLSVIIPTYNPNPGRLAQTLDGLKGQTLGKSYWELIIVDNSSSKPVTTDLSWHTNSKLVNEAAQGLTRARLKGISVAQGEIIVFVDDDNILDPHYLQNALKIFNSDQQLGAIGGKSLSLFEQTPPIWLQHFYSALALRNLGDRIIINQWNNHYPHAAPIGAGMCLRKQALDTYLQKTANGINIINDRTADMLTSGGDNDIVLEIIKSGWSVGYFPELTLQHIIPAERMKQEYLGRLIYNINYSWMQLLLSHKICPWKKVSPWTLPFRKAKAWLSYAAWKNQVNFINWRGACGMFDGLSI